MTDIMYDIPSRDDVKKCIITRETIEEGCRPALILKDGKRIDSDSNENIA